MGISQRIKRFYLFKRLQLFSGGVVVVLCLAWSGSVKAQESGSGCFDKNYTASLLFENDLWGSGSDKHFTHGSRLSIVQSKEIAEDKKDCVPEEDFVTMNFLNRTFGKLLSFPVDRFSFIFGQSIFTPEDITNPNLILTDRPYAGWLYAGIGLIHRHEDYSIPTIDSFELDLGIVGPEAYAGDVQIWWHENVTDSPRPEGWAHQLKNEPGVLLNVERKWRMELTPQNYEGLQVDFLPSVGVALGNVYTYGSLGGMVRLGVNLPKDYGPPRILPGAQGSDFFKVEKGKLISWYGYAGVEGRAMAVNIFLDGNTFADSHSVDKKYFVGDFHVGFVLVIYHARLAFSQVFRSSEFNGQKELSEFGSINLSVAW
jgi:hypothetical protein